MTIFLLINLCLVFCGLVESTGTAGPPKQSLPSPQNVGSGSKESTLDINNVDYSVFSINVELKDGIRSTIYRAKQGHTITSVVHEQEIWKSEKNNKIFLLCTTYASSHLSLALLEVKDPDVCIREYRLKVDESWKTVNKKDFEKRLEELKKEVPTNTIQESTLDIYDGNYQGVDMYKCIHNGLTILSFTATSTKTVLFVLDNGKEIWTAEEDGENCAYVWIHTLTNPSICRVEYLDKDGIIQTKYYQKNGSSWTPIDRRSYMQSYESIMIHGSIMVDIAHIDPYMCLHGSYSENDFLYTIFYPCSRYKVQTIIFCGRVSWESANEECTRFMGFKTDEGQLYELETRVGNSKPIPTYYQFKDDCISKIEDTHFSELFSLAEILKLGSPGERINVTGPINPLHCYVNESKVDGVRTMIYIPRPGVKTSFVFRHHLKIWEAEYGELCLRVEYTPCHNGSSFLCISIHALKGAYRKHLQATGQNGSFNEITESDYRIRLGLQNDPPENGTGESAQDDPSTAEEVEELTDDTDILQTN